ncbi:MAG: TerC family protein [Microscillaceae bacterium]|nr:TerC family protein [Microscillaceae bacterium]
MADILTTDALVSLVTLTFMEIVLGIDNVVFIAIIAGKLSPEQQAKARNYGLVLALIPRIILLLFISYLVNLKDNLIDLNLIGYRITMTEKGLVLFVGGLFLLYKSTSEIHEKLEGAEGHSPKSKKLSFSNALIQIILLNIVFSLDSILTAVGLAKQVEVMIIAVILALIVTLIFARRISDFVEKHPTVKMLALSFLLLIGFLLVVESFVVNGEEIHVPKGYIYFAMAFSLFVEILNLQMKKKREPLKLKTPYPEESL